MQAPSPQPIRSSSSTWHGMPACRASSAALACIAQGQTNKEIGTVLHLSEKTVRNYVSDILGKLGLTSRVQAAAYAARHGIERHLP